jgi:hypothetical protein
MPTSIAAEDHPLLSERQAFAKERTHVMKEDMIIYRASQHHCVA